METINLDNFNNALGDDDYSPFDKPIKQEIQDITVSNNFLQSFLNLISKILSGKLDKVEKNEFLSWGRVNNVRILNRGLKLHLLMQVEGMSSYRSVFTSSREMLSLRRDENVGSSYDWLRRRHDLDVLGTDFDHLAIVVIEKHEVWVCL